MSHPEDRVHSPYSRIPVQRAPLTSHQMQVLEQLLPLRSPLVEYPDRSGIAERAVAGIVAGALEYKAALLTPAVLVPLELVASLVHLLPHHDGAGWCGLGVGLAVSAVTGMASLAHVTNPPRPSDAASEYASHAGKLIGTGFGMSLTLSALGTTVWLGAYSAGPWIAGLAATVAGMIAHAAVIHANHGTVHARDTERIRATAKLAHSLTGPAMPPPHGAVSDQHPLSLEAVHAFAVSGFPGAVVSDAPSVVSADRWTLTADVPGVSFRAVKAREGQIAAALRVVAGGLTLSQGRRSDQVVVSVNNVPVAELPRPGVHPAVEAPGRSVSIWDPIRFGLDDDGDEVEIELPNTPGILIGAGPRMGKSNASAEILCHAAQSVDVERWLIDGSNRELTLFNRVAHQHCGPDIDKALVFTKAICQEITRRGELLQEAEKTELTRELAVELEMDCISLFIGELPFFTNHIEKKKRDLFNLQLRDILARGGAVGVFTVADAQKPESAVVPSAIRDMFGLRFCLRTENIDQTNTILGRGMGSKHPAHELNVADKGVGYLRGLPERGVVRVRTHKIEPEERVAIVDQVAGGFTAPPPIVPGPGGGQPVADAAPAPGWRGTHLRAVETYPDGSAFESRAYGALWTGLERLADGFTYRDVAALGVDLRIYAGRGSTQAPMDSWRERGLIVRIGERRGRGGPAADVYQRRDLRAVRVGATA